MVQEPPQLGCSDASERRTGSGQPHRLRCMSTCWCARRRSTVSLKALEAWRRLVKKTLGHKKLRRLWAVLGNWLRDEAQAKEAIRRTLR